MLISLWTWNSKDAILETMTTLEHIKKLKKKGWSKVDISNQLGISSERVRQLLSPKEKVKIDIKSEYKKYYKQISSDRTFLLYEIRNQTTSGRKKDEVFKKKAMVKYLRGELKLPYLVIAQLLNKDHTTIMHLFNTKPVDN